MWKPLVAGLSGTLVHFLFMYFKSRLGILPSFQPYQAFQSALSRWAGANVPAIVPWAFSLGAESACRRFRGKGCRDVYWDYSRRAGPVSTEGPCGECTWRSRSAR
jgi:hypothetical protein